MPDTISYIEVEIYFHDLNEEKQQEVMKIARNDPYVDSPEDMNWDTAPLAIVPIHISQL